jgi:DUF1680 family protein
MYVTAGFGPSAHNEGFTSDYDLPNDTAYAETCATVAMVFWAQRMLNLDLDSRYADTMELGLYNGGLSGLSHEGTHYFYENKLESDGSHSRWAWHPCPCCTMNVSRLVASIGGYFYSTGRDTIAVHLYGGSTASATIGDSAVTLVQKADFPWSGAVALTLETERPTRFTLKLRIPGWTEDPKVTVNGEAVEVAAGTEKGYLAITREWRTGDSVALDLPMPVRRLYAHPRVRMDVGKVALARGPLVYCLEQPDNAAPVQEVRLPRSCTIDTLYQGDFMGGAVLLKADGVAENEGDWTGLYRTRPPTEQPATLTAIPYYLWANRGPHPMEVWISERP